MDKINFIIITIFCLLFIFCVRFMNGSSGFCEHLSTHGMAISENMEFNNPFFMYHSRSEGEDGSVSYGIYNRFPPLPFLLIKFFSGFSPSLAGKILISRAVMLFFFAASICLSYLIADFILESKVKSLAATAFTFSTYYISFYSDLIFNDMPQLCCFILILYLILIKSSRKIVLFAVFLAALNGWQFISVIVAWFFIDALVALNCRSSGWYKSLKNLLICNSAIVLIFSLSLCFIMLSVLFVSESAASKTSLSSSDSFKSMILRLGMAPSYKYETASGKTNLSFYINQQLFRFVIGFYPFYSVRLAAPFEFVAAPLRDFGIKNPDISHYAIIADIYAGLMKYREHASAPAAGFRPFIIFLTAANLIIACLFFYSLYLNHKNYKIIYASALLIIAPVLWFVIFRHFIVAHDFQSIFYITPALAVYAGLAGMLNDKISPLIALAASILFFHNYFYVNQAKTLISADSSRLTIAFDSAREEIGENKKVYTDLSGYYHHDIDYYISGNIKTNKTNADIIITDYPHSGYENGLINKKIIVIGAKK